MMTLYTAVGRYKITGKGLPLVTAGGRECALTPHELILWSSLAFRILTYDKLKADFYKKEKELHILGELDFDHYLNRLIMRRLIASGRDCTGADALYDLLGRLYLQSLQTGFPVKILTFIKLCMRGDIPVRQAASIFHSQKLEPMEKQLISLLNSQLLSTAELIQCAQKDIRHLKNKGQLMECLYQDDATDCGSLITDSRFSELSIPVLTAITNLYFKQQVVFDIL